MRKRIGRRFAAVLAALTVLGLTPGLASAQVPPGKGLTTIDCDEFTATVTRGGGGPGWVQGDGSMWLVVGGTFTGPEGEFTFTQGKKTGLQDERATCSFTEGEFSAVIDLVRVR